MRNNSDLKNRHFDAIIIGSGFGGSMLANVLVNAGQHVLMLERGDWVKRGAHNWAMNASVDLTPHYSFDTPMRVQKGGNKDIMGNYACVGGPSVFYGGVSFRFREKDFEPPAEIVGDSGAEWPLTYADLEPYYSRAEQLLDVAGADSADPSAPPRSVPFPQNPDRLSNISEKVKTSAESLGLSPFPLPLAINYRQNGRHKCAACTTCDTFACAISAKNDLATVLIPKLIRKGMTLLPNTIVTRLAHNNGRITAVHAVDKMTKKLHEITADTVVLSAGAMSSPQLLLASGLAQHNSAGEMIGRFLMRHANAITFGIFPGKPDKETRFHKQLAILDYYFGHPDIKYPTEKLGSLQQMPTPPPGLVKEVVMKPFGSMIAPAVKLLTGLLAMVEDQPQFNNRIAIDRVRKNAYGLPEAQIFHKYSKRDLAALKVMTDLSKKIMRGTGAWAHYIHQIRTFSHACGTVRFGDNPKTAPLDRDCRFRGIDNLIVMDASFMPTAAAVNPSLTISATALRVGETLLNM